MATTTILLRITDGTTTCDFSTTSTTFTLRAPGWEPAVATLRENDLGGQSRYNDVDEPIPLYALGATAAIAHTNITALERLLSTAHRAERGEVQASVWLECQLQGSDLATYLRSRVRGGRITRLGPEYAEGALYAPAGIPLDLVVNRRGQWILATEEQSTQDTSFTSYDTAALTFPSSPATGNHPLRVTISGLTTASTSWYPGYVVVAPSGSHLSLVEAETTYTDGSSVSASTGAGRNSLARQISASTSAGNDFAVSAPLADSKQFHAFASVQVNSGTWRAFTRLYRNDGLTYADTPAIDIAPPRTGPSNSPQIYAFPPLAPSGTIYLAEIFFVLTSASGMINVDWLALAGDAQVVRIGNPSGYSASTPNFLEIDAKPIFGLKPTVRISTGGGTGQKLVPYEEDAYLVSGGGNTVGVMWLQNEYHATLPQWTITATGPGSAAKTHTVTVYRSLAYVVAQ